MRFPFDRLCCMHLKSLWREAYHNHRNCQALLSSCWRFLSATVIPIHSLQSCGRRIAWCGGHFWHTRTIIHLIDCQLQIRRFSGLGVIVICLDLPRQRFRISKHYCLTTDLANKSVQNWFNRYFSDHGTIVAHVQEKSRTIFKRDFSVRSY